MIRRIIKPENYRGVKIEFPVSISTEIDKSERRNSEDDIVVETCLVISIYSNRLPPFFYRTEILEPEIEIENAIQAFVIHYQNEMKKIYEYFHLL